MSATDYFQQGESRTQMAAGVLRAGTLQTNKIVSDFKWAGERLNAQVAVEERKTLCDICSPSLVFVGGW